MEAEWRRWWALLATVWIQASTGTNFDFPAYSAALKAAIALPAASGGGGGVSSQQRYLSYLATASDLGKALGWTSGLALLHIPLPAVLLLAAAMGAAAYALQFCTLAFPALAVPYHAVFMACVVAGCSICWFNTVCFVVCTRAFPAASRPLALSLSTSFNGLSAAFYTLFADAMAPGAPSVYLLLNAALPLAVSLLSLPPVLLLPPSPEDDGVAPATRHRHRRVFLGFYIIAVVTGVYLVALGSFDTTGSTAWIVLAGAMALLGVPLIIPAASCISHPDDDAHAADTALLPLIHNNKDGDDDHQHEEEYQQQGCCPGDNKGGRRLLVLGEEHSVKRLLCCADFWFYYAAYFCGATVGLVYSNNLGQIAQSLNRQSQLPMLLAVYSSCSFFGRLLSALPDFLPRKVSFARTGWLAAALVPMPMAFFIMWTWHDDNTLVAGTALIGLSSGFIFAAAVSVTSELFGPNSIGVNHNILITNIPLGSLLFGQVAAIVYDANGLKKTVRDNRTGMVDTMVVCMSEACYSTTFFLWGCITLLGLASSVALFLRTRPAYATAAGQSSCKKP